MAYLGERNGKIPYSDGTSAALIKDKFNISKAAFKRALGHLMKENKIIQEDGWTLLTDYGRQFLADQESARVAQKAQG